MILEALKKPSLILPKKHIILLSHMRANTTLLGHIFGSHPDVSGYYEHHIGYYSWKSLVREKIKFSTENPKEPTTKYYFDKILHNEHVVSDGVWKKEDVSLFFMLRKPERTIKSIVKLYKRVNPEHNFSSIDFATNYYIERLDKIASIAEEYSQEKDVFYLDSERIINSTEDTLNRISNWFGLSPNLSSEYKLFELSGKRTYGDSSEYIKNRRVSKNNSNYDDVIIGDKALALAESSYDKAKKRILDVAKYSVADT